MTQEKLNFFMDTENDIRKVFVAITSSQDEIRTRWRPSGPPSTSILSLLLRLWLRNAILPPKRRSFALNSREIQDHA